MEPLKDQPFLLNSPFMIGDICKQGWKIYFELIIWKASNREICKLYLGNSNENVIDKVFSFIQKEEINFKNWAQSKVPQTLNLRDEYF